MLSLEAARMALRLSHKELDEEINSLLAAAKADLLTAGVHEPDGDATLYDNAMRMYLRAHFWPDDDMSKRALDVYKDLKGTMKMIDKYRGAEDGGGDGSE